MTGNSIEPIPLTVVGGFIGAGKTTLLNHLLRHAGGIRFAVLVNDFGDLAIDGDLIAEHGGDTMTLANGCICCTLGDDLMTTLIGLAARDAPPQHILVEASGVAEPARIADIAVLHPRLIRDAVVVLVDAQTVRDKAADRYVGDTVARQLADADILLVNKCDLVEEQALEVLRLWLREQAPQAGQVLAKQAQVAPGLLLGFTGLDPAPDDPLDAGGQATPTHAHDGHEHTAEVFRTFTVVLPDPVDESEFRAALDGLPDAVLRAKGYVRFRADPPRRRLLQLVGRRYDITDDLQPDRAGTTQIVFLGTPDMPDPQTIAATLDPAARVAPGAGP